MREQIRRPLGIVVVSVLLVALAAGAALAADITCTGGPCDGTPDPDNIHGSQQVDLIRAMGGSDRIDGNPGDDTINGGPDDEILT